MKETIVLMAHSPAKIIAPGGHFPETHRNSCLYFDPEGIVFHSTDSPCDEALSRQTSPVSWPSEQEIAALAATSVGVILMEEQSRVLTGSPIDDQRGEPQNVHADDAEIERAVLAHIASCQLAFDSDGGATHPAEDDKRAPDGLLLAVAPIHEAVNRRGQKLVDLLVSGAPLE